MDPETQKNGRAVSLSFSFASPFVLASFSRKHFPNGKKKRQPLKIPHLFLKQSKGEKSPSLLWYSWSKSQGRL